jgi:hypothetical protein
MPQGCAEGQKKRLHSHPGHKVLVGYAPVALQSFAVFEPGPDRFEVGAQLVSVVLNRSLRLLAGHEVGGGLAGSDRAAPA